MAKKKFFDPIDPWDWMKRIAKTLEHTISLQQSMEKDLMWLKKHLDHVTIEQHKITVELENLRLDITPNKVVRKIENDPYKGTLLEGRD